MFVNPSSVFLTHKGQAGRLLSPRLWGEAKGQMLAPDGSLRGYYIAEDFRTFGGILDSDISATVGLYIGEAGAYRSYQDSGDTIAQIATDRFGVVRLATAATDNNEAWLQPGGSASVMGLVSDTAGDDRPLVFEARVKFTQVSDNGGSVFVGLSEEGCTAADTKVNDTGVLVTTKDFIGFDTLHADGDALRFIYQKGSQTQQVVLTKAISAGTWYNLGFVYDPKAKTTERIKIYVDNELQSTFVTGANIAAATFPDGEELQPLFGIKTGAAAIASLDIDGYAFYQAD